MRKAYILIILGIFMAVLPYLGFPYSWKDTLETIFGLLIALIGYFLFRDKKDTEINKKNYDNFLENDDFYEKESREDTEEESPHIRI